MPTKWTMWKKWIEAYNLPRLNQQEIDNWNRWIATNETDLTATTKKGWIHETISTKLSRRAVVYPSQNIKSIWRGGDTPQFILEDHHYWHQKKISQKKNKNARPRSLIIIDAKTLNKILANWFQQGMKRLIHLGQDGLIARVQWWFNICKSIKMIHPVNKNNKTTWSSQ